MSSLFLSSLLSMALASETPGSTALKGSFERVQALYAHPHSTVVQHLSAPEGGNVPFILPLTYEREFDDGKSWTLQPTISIGSQSQNDTAFYAEDHSLSEGYELAPDLDIIQFQLSASQRSYFNNKVCKGWYWAPAVNVLYAHISQPYQDGKKFDWPARTMSALGIGVLGYVGWRGKWGAFTMYVDGGLGGQCIKYMGNSSRDLAATSLTLDLNLGMGRAF